tara:strand:+ start:317 stop:484 length:168 start_codon:yes stop_codon:yes gene_type:complete
MQIGSLVRYLEDGDLGIVVALGVEDDSDNAVWFQVRWGDGTDDWHQLKEVEVLCK